MHGLVRLSEILQTDGDNRVAGYGVCSVGELVIVQDRKHW